MGWQSWAMGLFFIIGGALLTLSMLVLVVYGVMHRDWEGVSLIACGLFMGVACLWLGVKWWGEFRPKGRREPDRIDAGDIDEP